MKPSFLILYLQYTGERLARSNDTVISSGDVRPQEQYPVEGKNLYLRTQIPRPALPVSKHTAGNPLSTQIAYDEITHVQTERGRLVWRYALDALVQAERWQAVSDMGNDMVLYESREAFDGLLLRLVGVLHM